MKKLMLATTIALLVGATASPAFAVEQGRRAGGEASVQAAPKGAAPEESREDREEREASRDDRRDARHEIRDGQRDARDAVRSGDRQALRDWAAANEGRRGPRADVSDVARPTGIARPPAQVRPAPVQARPAPVLAQHGDGDRYEGRDGNRDGRYDGRDGNRYDGRDGNRYDGRYDGRDGNRHDRDTYDRNRHYDWRNEWRNDRHDWRDGDRRDGRYYTRYRDARWSGYQWYPQYRYRAPSRYAYPYGYRPYRWSVGYRMPYGYYNSPSYILDWRYYRLPMPPMGYEWVRVDRDVVLVHMFSGYIRDVLFGLFY